MNSHLQGSSSPEEHAQYVWKNFVKKSKAKRIDIVAHSYGGVVAAHLVGTKKNPMLSLPQGLLASMISSWALGLALSPSLPLTSCTDI